jgi:mannose-6-phosphate isomerase-like protein (cupin superfamily)
MVQLRRLDRANLTRAYGADGERLLPWPALNAPFEGAWVVVRAGTESTPHAHHEYEIFIAVSGRSTLYVDDDRRDFVAGDIAYMPPGSTHRVAAGSDVDFEYYSIWWDTEMSHSFVARHGAAA